MIGRNVHPPLYVRRSGIVARRPQRFRWEVALPFALAGLGLVVQIARSIG